MQQPFYNFLITCSIKEIKNRLGGGKGRVRNQEYMISTDIETNIKPTQLKWFFNSNFIL